MKRWPVERTWTVVSGRSTQERVRTSDLRRYRACSTLGAAGLGKTAELRHLADVEASGGVDVRFARLVELGQSPDALRTGLDRLVAGATAGTVIYLDALDELMVPLRTAGVILAGWIRDRLATPAPALRVSCRSAVWPASVDSAMREVYGHDEYANAYLQPLAPTDVAAIASAEGVDPSAFAASVAVSGAAVLSQQPLALRMLLRVFATSGSLPAGRKELFAQGVACLAAEREERLGDGTTLDIPTVDVLEAAERLACFTLLSGREVIDLRDAPSGPVFGRLELEALPSDREPLTDRLLRAVCMSGLCEGDAPGRFRFSHRQFAEYLAGRRLARLLPHQAKSLLASGPGWQEGVAGPLRETAAFAAMESRDLAAWIAACDLEVMGLSDVADVGLRRQATLDLLAMFRLHEMTDAQLGRDDIDLPPWNRSGDDVRIRA